MTPNLNYMEIKVIKDGFRPNDDDETGADGVAGAATDWRERARRARGVQRKREAKRRRDAGPPVTRGSAVT